VNFLKFFLSLFILIVPFIIGCTNNINSNYDAYFISPNERVTLEQEVKKGDTKAAEKLAYHYLYAEHDNEKAIEYMRILAISGNARMQHNMAAALINSQDLKCRQEGVDWYKLSAKAGIKNSQYDLARLYEEGKIITKNYCEAMFWYEKTALSDDVYSMVKMAEFYKEGKCEEKDLIQSYSWLRLAELNTSNKSSLGKSIRNKEKRLINQLSEKEIELGILKFEKLKTLLDKNIQLN